MEYILCFISVSLFYQGESSEKAGKRHVTLVDGGFSTQLERHVGEQVDGHPLWCARFLATGPLQVLHTHLDYLRGKMPRTRCHAPRDIPTRRFPTQRSARLTARRLNFVF